ncbi:MAG: HlyD family efflux transporter periplasmic adaptor subunit [Pirellulales bacterium]
MRKRFTLTAAFGLIVATAMATVGFGQLPGRGPALQQRNSGDSKALEFRSEFRLECLRKIDVAAQADGLIQEMLVEEGLTIPKEGVLFKIDNRVAQAQLEVATKKLESAQKKASQDAEVRFAQATFDVAQAEYEKEVELLTKKASTEATARRKGLEAKKAMLQIEVATVTHETDILAAGVAQAEQNAARVQLGLYDIVAPWDAYVNERLKDQGAWIKAGEPVLKIHHMAEMKVVGLIKAAQIHERGLSISSLEGCRVQINVDITPTQTHTVDSKISFVSAELDATDRIKVSAQLKNERIGNSWLLRDNMPTRVVLFPE